MKTQLQIQTKVKHVLCLMALMLYSALGWALTEITEPLISDPGITILTDKEDYAPLSNAVFSGSGFEPFEEVVLRVKNLTQPCNTTHADQSYAPWTVATDADGSFVTNWTVCDCAGDSLRLKVTGQTSGLIGYAYFTDSAPWTLTVSSSASPLCTGNSTTLTFIATAGGNGSGSIACMNITVPSAFNNGNLGLPNITAASSTGGVGGWTASISSGIITLVANGNTNRLGINQTLTFTISATPTTSIDSPFIWTAIGGSNTNCTPSGSNPNPVTQPSLSVSPLASVSATNLLTNSTESGVCEASVSFGSNVSTTGTPTLTYSLVSGDFSSPITSPYVFPVGNTTVYIRASNVCGDAFASFTVEVEDDEDPVLTAALDQDVNLDGACDITVPDLVAQSSATDNCTVTITQSPVAGTVLSSSHNQTHTVTITATDGAGNTDEEDVTLTAKDITAPVLTAALDQDVNLDGACDITVPDLVAQSSATDNCTVTITQSPVAGTVLSSSHNQTHTVTITATDGAGNTDDEDVTLTAKDVTAPVAEVQPYSLQLDNTGNATLLVDSIDNGSSDNCGILTYALSQTEFDCSHIIGTHNVILTVTDGNNNSASATAVVTVLAPLVPVEVEISSTVTPNSSDNIVVFDNAAAFLNLPDATTLKASITSSYTVETYEWFFRNLPDGDFIPVGGDIDSLVIEAMEDFHREYLVEITTNSGCFASASVIVFSINTACGNGGTKVRICHIPPGNPANARNICVSQNAVAALLENSDSFIGSCNSGYKMNEDVPLLVNIYPNPTQTNLNISLEGGNIKAEYIQLYDMQGRLIQTVKVAEYENSILMEIDMSMKENGIYILNVFGNSQILSTKKVVKTS